MPVKVSLLKLTQSGAVKKLYENNHMIQDLLVPTRTMKNCLEKFNSSINIYPLWVCPFILPNDPGMVHPKANKSELYVDIGIYGVPNVKNFNAVKSTRFIEDLVDESEGFQMLYADTYRSRDEFRKMFDHNLYEKMRNKLNCKKAFPEVYDKVNKNVRS